MSDLCPSCRGLLLARGRRADPRRDPGAAAAAHRGARAARRPGRGRGGDGGRGGGHPGHGGAPVRGLRGAALRPHAALLPRPPGLPDVVGGGLPGHQLPVRHLLPPVPHAELTEDAATGPLLTTRSYRGNNRGFGQVFFVVFEREETGDGHGVVAILTTLLPSGLFLYYQQATAVTQVHSELGPVSQSWLLSGSDQLHSHERAFY